MSHKYHREYEKSGGHKVMHILYAMEPEALEEYRKMSAELRETKKGMSAADIIAAKNEILQAAQINDIDPDKSISLHYSTDENGIAHIPVTGMLTNSVDPCAAFFGQSVTTYNFISQTALDADNNPDVKEIYFHFDTRGGHVAGVDVASQVIYNLKKPTIGINHGAALSGGYWLISQTKKIIDQTPTAFSGSIGVAIEIIDRGSAEKLEGIERRFYTSTDAPNKRRDLSTDEGQARLIQELDDVHEIFVQRVSEGRSRALNTIITKEKINSDFGQGGILISTKAKAVGMIDEIMNLKNSTHIKNENSPAQAGEKTRSKMNLDEFLNQNAEARAEYEKRIAASAESVENRIKAVMPILGSDAYAKAHSIARQALSGEIDISSFRGAIAAFDMLTEQDKTKTAQNESEETEKTPGQQQKTPSTDGTVKAPEDIAGTVSLLKGALAGGL